MKGDIMSELDTLDTLMSLVEIIVGIAAVYTIVSICGATSKLGIICMIACACGVAYDTHIIVTDTDAIGKVKRQLRSIWKR